MSREFASIIRPGGRLDKNYLVLKKKHEQNGTWWDQFVIVEKEHPSKEIARISFRPRKDVMAVSDVFTHSEYRRLGLLTFLSKLVEQEAKNKNCKQMMLYSSKKGMPFWKKVGFKSIEMTPYFSKKTAKEIKFTPIKTMIERNLEKIKREKTNQPKIRTFAEREMRKRRR